MFCYHINDDIQLRLLEKRDNSALFSIINANANVLFEWVPWVEYLTSLEDTNEYIEDTLQRYVEGKGAVVGVWFHQQLVGLVELDNVHFYNQTAEIGYWLIPSAGGNGIMTKACKVMIRYAFEVLKLNRIELRTSIKNENSKRMAGRLNLTKEAVLRQASWLNGAFHDMEVHALLLESWKRATQEHP